MGAVSQQNQNIVSGTGIKVKDIPYSQSNTTIVDPTPGIIIAIMFFVVIGIILKRADYWVQKFYEHKVEIDKLALKNEETKIFE